MTTPNTRHRIARVLLVDDDLRTLRRFAKMLEEDGYDVAIAGDCSAAIAELDRGPPPDVLVTDLMIPNGSGVLVMQHARAGRPDLPVIFITGYPELLAKFALAEPSPVVFTKPISYADVNAALGRLAPGGPVH